MIHVTDFIDALELAEYGASQRVDKELAILELERLRVKIEAL